MQGAHTSFSVVIGVVVISGAIGLLAGTVAGLRGGFLDDVVMRLVEIAQTVPRFFLSVLAVAWFGPGGRTLTILLGLTSWPLIARVLRAEALSLREQGFVGAARSMGASDLRILLHLLEVAWWMWVFPGAAIVTAVLGMNLLADGLTGALAHE